MNAFIKRMYRYYFLFVLSVVTIVKSDTLWTKTIDIKDGGCLASIKQLRDSNFVFVGSFYSGMLDSMIPNTDVSITKLDKNGNSIWTRTYGNDTLQELGLDVLVLDDSSFLILANTGYFGNHQRAAWVIKIDQMGDTVWAHYYSDSGMVSISRAICQTADSGFIVIGQVGQRQDTTTRVWLFKIDSKGILKWTRTLGSYFPYSIFQINNTDRYVFSACTTAANQPPSYLFWIDSIGNIINTKKYDRLSNELIAIPFKSQIIAGGFISHPPTNPDLTVFKADSLGNILWQQDFLKADCIGVPSFAVTQSGELLFATDFLTDRSFNGHPYNIAVMRINESGEILNSEIINNLTYLSHGTTTIQSTFDDGYILSAGQYDEDPGLSDANMYIRRASNQLRNLAVSSPIIINGKMIDQDKFQLSVSNLSLAEVPDSVALRFSMDSTAIGLSDIPNLVVPAESSETIFLNDLARDSVYYFSVSYKNIFGTWSEIAPSNITKLVTTPDSFPSDPIQRFSFSPKTTRLAPHYIRFSWNPMEFDDNRIKWVGVSIDIASFPIIDSLHPPQYVFNTETSGFDWYCNLIDTYYISVTAGIGNMAPVKWADRTVTAIEPVSPALKNISKRNIDHVINFLTNGKISCDLQNPGYIKLEIYNATGRLVETVFEGYRQKGLQLFQWKNKQRSPGIYLCKISTSTMYHIAKTTFLK